MTEPEHCNTLNIVLVEPRIPQNTGNVARTCAVTGARLHLVGPMGFAIDDRKLKRAGLDYWGQLDITYYQDYRDFLSKNAGPFFYFTSKGLHRHTDVLLPGRLLSGLWAGGCRPARVSAGHPPRPLCALSHAKGRALPEPFQLGGGGRL